MMGQGWVGLQGRDEGPGMGGVGKEGGMGLQVG